MNGRWRSLVGVWALAEIAVFVLVAVEIGVGWTILASLGTSALGLSLMGRQGTRALADLRELKDPVAPHHSQARGGPLQRGRESIGRVLGNAGLVALGGLLMVLPGFLGDLAGLLCLLPGTRVLPRFVAARLLARQLPDAIRGPVRVRSVRTPPVAAEEREASDVPVIEGEVLGRPSDAPGR